MDLDRTAERAYMFEHVWRQIYKKFYVSNMHGVDWEFYKKEYTASSKGKLLLDYFEQGSLKIHPAKPANINIKLNKY